MKNYIPATFLLTLIVVGVLMGLYFLPSMSVGGKPLRKVDLLADILSLIHISEPTRH